MDFCNPLSISHEICFARPLPHNHSSRLADLQNERDEISARASVFEDQNKLLIMEASSLRSERGALLETITSQANQLGACEQQIALLSQELRAAELQRLQAQAKCDAQGVRVLDLERSITNLTRDLLASEAAQNTTAQRLVDMARELATLQQRFNIQADANKTFELQLAHANHFAASINHLPAQEPPTTKEMPEPQQAPRTSEFSYEVATQLESDLLARSKQRDLAASRLAQLENTKLRTIADKARKDALTHEVSLLNNEISDIRKQLRSMNLLIK